MKIMITIGLSIICLGFTVYAKEAEKNEKYAAIQNDFPLAGNWQIISYQVIGDPKMNRAEIKTWMNRVIKFNSKTAIMYKRSTMKVCSISEIQVAQKNAEGYFLIGYKVKPHRLGVIDKEIKVTTLTCTAESWFGKTQEFVNLSDEQTLIYWDGVLFYLVKQMNNQKTTSQVIDKLFVMPQSVATLMPDTVFSQEVLVATFPNYQLKQLVRPVDEKQVLKYFELYQEDMLKLIVYSNPNTMTINKIRIFDEQAMMPGGVQLGDIHQDIFNNEFEFIDCQANIGERHGQTTCSFKNMSMIQYVFEPKNIINGELVSPIEALNRAKLVEVIWNADSSLITGKSEVNSVLSPAGVLENADAQAAATIAPVDLEAAYKIQEKQLNEVSHQLMTLLERQAPKPAKTTTSAEAKISSQATAKADLSHLLTIFRAAQTAWMQYRDDNCHWHSILVANKGEKFTCLEKITVERIKEIEAIFKHLEAKTTSDG